MSINHYGNLIEQWKVDLIHKQARRLGFRQDDIPDLEQRIVLELINVSFEEEGTACQATFTAAVIDHLLKRELRDRKRHVRRVSFEACSLENVAEPVSSRSDAIGHAMLRLDLEAALERLSVEERTVCEMFRQGDTQADIARSLGRSESTVSRAVRTLRERFGKWGLDKYLEKSGVGAQGSGDSG